MDQIRLSVVIPVYNTAAYFEACTGSLKAQTFTDWEAILVDDGSTDESGALCDALAAADPRFRVLHQKNSGPSAARMAGLDAARGEGVAFIDSDDIIPPDYYSTLWQIFEGCDLALCAFDEITPEGVTRIGNNWDGGDTAAYLRAFLYADEAPLPVLSCENKIYRTALLRGCAREGVALRRCEDVLMNLNYLFCAKSVRTTNATAYGYQKRGGSLTGRFHADIIEGQARQLALLQKLLAHHGLDTDRELARHHSMYRTDSFFFTVYQITDAQLGRSETVRLLDDLLGRCIIRGKDVAAARPHTLPWLLLRVVLGLKSGFGMLAWLILAGKLHWA